MSSGLASTKIGSTSPVFGPRGCSISSSSGATSAVGGRRKSLGAQDARCLTPAYQTSFPSCFSSSSCRPCPPWLLKRLTHKEQNAHWVTTGHRAAASGCAASEDTEVEIFTRHTFGVWRSVVAPGQRGMHVHINRFALWRRTERHEWRM